jgi:hypothetical protein
MAVTMSSKVESTENGEDKVVWGSKVSPGSSIALAKAVALVLDLVVGVMTDDKIRR